MKTLKCYRWREKESKWTQLRFKQQCSSKLRESIIYKTENDAEIDNTDDSDDDDDDACEWCSRVIIVIFSPAALFLHWRLS